MSYRLVTEDILSVAADAAVLGVEMTMRPADGPVCGRLAAAGGEELRRPEIVSYVGYYRDHAGFALDNGLFARVDLRREIRDVSVIPYFEACCRVANNPLQPPLPEEEIRRLMQIYEEIG